VVSRVAWAACSLVGLAVWMTAVPAHSQSNLDAGKSAAQIFATTCINCHRSAREIKRTTNSFMREHYTTGSQEAAAMAAYLASVGSDPKAIELRRKPAMGAGQAGPSEAAAKSGDAQAALNENGKSGGGKLRRPAESMEAGVPMAAVAAAAPSAERAGAVPTAPAPAQDIEE